MSKPLQLEAVFFAALEKETPHERSAYLESACAGDAELRRQVEKLLNAHPKVGDFLKKPVVDRLAAAERPDATQELGPSTDGECVAPVRREPTRTEAELSAEEDDGGLQFLSPSTRPDSLGRIGHYEVLEVLGKGGFGIVFRAFDDVLQRVVALKVLAPAIAVTSPARKRFLREARSSAQVRHENVVQVYAVEEQPLPYLVMEYIPGETLQQRLDRIGPLEVPEVLRIGRQIAEALAAAHATELIHRDIKPGNVLIEKGPHERVKITDFGLARAADDASLTHSGVVAGTPMYMSPEQANGDSFDHRADLFSLGSVLYVMCTGRPPFRASTTLAVLKRVADDEPRPIREVIPEVPEWLCAIVAKLHAKDPAARFQTAREVADLLADRERKLQQPTPTAEISLAQTATVVPAGNVPQATSSRIWKWTAAAVLVLPFVAWVAFELTRPDRDPDNANNGHVDPQRPAKPVDEQPAAAGTGFREIHDADRTKFDAWLTRIRAEGYLPQTLNAWGTSTREPRYAAVAIRNSDSLDWLVVHQTQADDRFTKNEALRDQGYRPISRALHLGAQEVGFTDLWIKGRDPGLAWGIFSGSRNLIDNRLKESRGIFLRPISICACRSAKMNWFFGVALVPDEGIRWHFEWQLTKAELLKQMDQRRAENWRPECLAVHAPGGQWQYATVFIENTDSAAWSISLDLSTKEYEQELERQRKLGFRPVNLCARDDGKDTRYAVIWRGASAKNSPSSAFAPFDVERIAALPAAEQIEEVRKELKRRNPDFDGALTPRIENEVVTGLAFSTDQVSDMSPVRALTKLNSLSCFASEVGRGQLGARALLPLKGLPLTKLNCRDSPALSDLSPLKEMELTSLDLRHTNVGDADVKNLAGLKNLQLLVLWGTKVTDAGLKELAGMKNLQHLSLQNTGITDVGLKELSGLDRLLYLDLYAVRQVTDDGLKELATLKSLKDLDLRGTSVTEAGPEKLAAVLPSLRIVAPKGRVIEPKVGLAPFTDADVKRIAALPAAEQVEEVRAELKKRNPEFKGSIEHTLAENRVHTMTIDGPGMQDISPVRALPELQVFGLVHANMTATDLAPLRGMGLTRLDLFHTGVSDLSPLQGMNTLRNLDLSASKKVTDLSPLHGIPLKLLTIHGTGISDLTPLKDMRLELLNCNGSKVSDLSPLKGMPLTTLYLGGTAVTDLAPLKDLPLKALSCDYQAARDAKILRAIKTLETINGKPAAEVLKEPN